MAFCAPLFFPARSSLACLLRTRAWIVVAAAVCCSSAAVPALSMRHACSNLPPKCTAAPVTAPRPCECLRVGTAP